MAHQSILAGGAPALQHLLAFNVGNPVVGQAHRLPNPRPGRWSACATIWSCLVACRSWLLFIGVCKTELCQEKLVSFSASQTNAASRGQSRRPGPLRADA